MSVLSEKELKLLCASWRGVVEVSEHLTQIGGCMVGDADARVRPIMMKGWNHIRFLGFGGFLCGGLVGLLFLLYPNHFPKHITLEDIVLVSGFLGAAFHRPASTLIFKPFLYYANLTQLMLLRQHIGEQTQSEIIKELTMKYFLGENYRDQDSSR